MKKQVEEYKLPSLSTYSQSPARPPNQKPERQGVQILQQMEISLPGTGQEPGKPGLRSRLGGGLMLLVTGSPAGLGGDHTEGSGMTVPLPFSRREGRAEGSHAWRARC